MKLRLTPVTITTRARRKSSVGKPAERRAVERTLRKQSQTNDHWLFTRAMRRWLDADPKALAMFVAWYEAE